MPLLDLQTLHRRRQRPIVRRTSLINQMRAFLLERGIAVAQGRGFYNGGRRPVSGTGTRIARTLKGYRPVPWAAVPGSLEAGIFENAPTWQTAITST